MIQKGAVELLASRSPRLEDTVDVVQVATAVRAEVTGPCRAPSQLSISLVSATTLAFDCLGSAR